MIVETFQIHTGNIILNILKIPIQIQIHHEPRMEYWTQGSTDTLENFRDFKRWAVQSDKCFDIVHPHSLFSLEWYPTSHTDTIHTQYVCIYTLHIETRPEHWCDVHMGFEHLNDKFCVVSFVFRLIHFNIAIFNCVLMHEWYTREKPSKLIQP